jgi:integrase
MPRTPTFKVKNTPQGWCLNVPASLSDTGKQQRRYFPTRASAQEFAARLRGDYKKHGEGASVLPPRVAGDAAAAWKLLEPFGRTLLEAARHLVEKIESEESSVNVKEFTESFLTAKGELSDTHASKYRISARLLAEFFPDRILRSITHGEILDYLSARTTAPATYNLEIRILTAMWRWAAKPPRQWCSDVTVKGLERRVVQSGDIGTLKASEVKNLLDAAEANYPHCVVPFAIAIFTGMRQQEIARLTPEDITAEGITVPALSSKTKRRRYIQMPEPLAEWLKAYPVGVTVCPPNWNRRQRAVRRLAGWRVWSDDFDPPEAPLDLPRWPENALRHTAATVMLALGKPLEKLIFEHGHSGGVATLQRHYIGRVSKAEAAAIWGLRPSRALASQAHSDADQC